MADQIHAGMVRDGLSPDEARSRIWLTDRAGLVTDDMEGLPDYQRAYARPASEVAHWTRERGAVGLFETVRRARPTILIGTSTDHGAFTRRIVEAMSEGVERPIVLPLSNPTERIEAMPADVIAWSKGRALVATGIPISPFDYDGTRFIIGQGNNSLLYPGLGLGVIVSGASRVTDGMLLTVRAAAVLADSGRSTYDAVAAVNGQRASGHPLHAAARLARRGRVTRRSQPSPREQDAPVGDGLEGLASRRTRAEGAGSMTTALTAVALALGIARLIMFIALHLVPSDYNIVQHAVSDYAVGPTHRLATAVTWTSAVFWAALAGAVALGPPTPEKNVALWLAALAVIFAALPLLPTDVEGQPATLIGRLHLVAAIAWFSIAYSCMGSIVRLLTPLAPRGLVSFLGVTRWVTAAALIALVTALVIRRLRPYAFGISERIFLLAVYVFYLGTAAGILLV